MKDFILDASVTVAWCFDDEATPDTQKLLDKLTNHAAFVPSIWSLEVGNVLINAERRKRINYAKINEFISLLKSINIKIDEETSMKGFQEILSLAHSEKLTTYDAAYLELAMRMGLPLASKDNELRKAATRLGLKLII